MRKKSKKIVQKSMRMRIFVRGSASFFLLPSPSHLPAGHMPFNFPYSIEDTAAITGYTTATVSRWISKSSMPICAFRLVMLHAYGLMPNNDGAWNGFRVRGDSILTPEGRAIMARDLANLYFILNHRENLRDYNRRLHARVRELEEELKYSQIPLLKA